MSFARWGWLGSDVYVFFNVDHKYECCGCSIHAHKNELHSFLCDTIDEMIIHLHEHRKRGDTVPQETFEELEDEKP